MRKCLLGATALAAVMLASAAQAADLPRKAPVVKAPVVAPFSWTGFYIGGHVGYGWGRKEWSDFFDPQNPLNGVPGPDADYDVDGFLAGGQIGYNWQSGWTVFGIEADASWADISGSGKNSPALPGNCLQQDGGCTSKIEAFGTITARLGVAVDRALFYAKGGAAWVHEKHTTGSTTDPQLQWSGTTSDTRWGWTIGGGIEYALSSNWSGKIEYNYLDFDKDEVRFTFSPPPGFGAAGTLHQTLHVVKAGVNYRFGGPLVAKY
jgi:outer membrane immunogenic protein